MFLLFICVIGTDYLNCLKQCYGNFSQTTDNSKERVLSRVYVYTYASYMDI